MKSIEDRMCIAETALKAVQKRLDEAELQLALCLRFIRLHAEKLAQEKDPNFKVHENHKA